MKLARPLPKFINLIYIEFILSVGIIATTSAILIPNINIAITKAVLSKLMGTVDPVKVDWMINMALTGDDTIPDSIIKKEQYLPSIGKEPLQMKFAGNVIRFEGTMDKPFYLTFYPSMIAEGPPGSIMLMCGNKKPPTGWTKPANTGTDLPPEVLPTSCRD